MGNYISSLSTTAEQALKGREMSGKTVLITGGSSGIGLEVTRVLALAKAKVYVGCPNIERGREAIDSIREAAGSEADIMVLELDLASFRSINGFVERFKALIGEQSLDVLILNAAVMQTPQWKTREGFEYQLGINFLGHVHLATALIEGVMLHKAMEGQQSRVLVTTCRLPLDNPELLKTNDLNYAVRSYSSGGAYSQSKLALSVWAADLASRLEGVKNIGVFIVNPGVAVTRLNRFLPFFSVVYDMAVAPFVKTVPQAAATTVHCATAPRLLESSHGGYFENCKRYKPPPVLQNGFIAEKLRIATADLVSNAVIDSHQPIDYNPGKMMWKRFHDLFFLPLMQRFQFLTSKSKSS